MISLTAGMTEEYHRVRTVPPAIILCTAQASPLYHIMTYSQRTSLPLPPLFLTTLPELLDDRSYPDFSWLHAPESIVDLLGHLHPRVPKLGHPQPSERLHKESIPCDPQTISRKASCHWAMLSRRGHR
jgi:hypothetical protein